jgi:hypothetical protein
VFASQLNGIIGFQISVSTRFWMRTRRVTNGRGGKRCTWLFPSFKMELMKETLLEFDIRGVRLVLKHHNFRNPIQCNFRTHELTYNMKPITFHFKKQYPINSREATNRQILTIHIYTTKLHKRWIHAPTCWI